MCFCLGWRISSFSLLCAGLWPKANWWGEVQGIRAMRAWAWWPPKIVSSDLFVFPVQWKNTVLKSHHMASSMFRIIYLWISPRELHKISLARVTSYMIQRHIDVVHCINWSRNTCNWRERASIQDWKLFSSRITTVVNLPMKRRCSTGCTASWCHRLCSILNLAFQHIFELLITEFPFFVPNGICNYRRQEKCDLISTLVIALFRISGFSVILICKFRPRKYEPTKSGGQSKGWKQNRIVQFCGIRNRCWDSKWRNSQSNCCVWTLLGGLLPSKQELEYSFPGFIPTNKQTNKQTAFKFKSYVSSGVGSNLQLSGRGSNLCKKALHRETLQS